MQVKEVLESEIDVADYEDIKEEIKTQFKDAVDDFREEKVSEYKAAHSGVSDKEAENAVAGQSFKASDIVAQMSRFKVNDWSISFKADGSNPDVIIFTVSVIRPDGSGTSGCGIFHEHEGRSGKGPLQTSEESALHLGLHIDVSGHVHHGTGLGLQYLPGLDLHVHELKVTSCDGVLHAEENENRE